eukprot:scaffold118451_cov27-Tisochrysis_lutea.AAC.2
MDVRDSEIAPVRSMQAGLHAHAFVLSLVLRRWLIRVLLGYRNTLVRYELTLNKFLRDKVEMRGKASVTAFALSEARVQRARRAAALLEWMQRGGGDADAVGSRRGEPRARGAWDEATLLAEASEALGRGVPFQRALQELRRLGLVREVSKTATSTGVTAEAPVFGANGSTSAANVPPRSRQFEVVADWDHVLEQYWAGLLRVES